MIDKRQPAFCSHVPNALHDQLKFTWNIHPLLWSPSVLMTDTCYNFTIILTSFRDYAYALFFPPPSTRLSYSRVCGTLGGERRLLQSRFVVWALNPSVSLSLFAPAWSDGDWTQHVFTWHYVTFFFWMVVNTRSWRLTFIRDCLINQGVYWRI